MAEYKKIVPYNVTPQVRTQLNLDSSSLKCSVDDDLQAVVIDNNNLSVIRGPVWKTNVSLIEFFHPCEQYIEYEILLDKHVDPDELILDFGNIAADDGGITFIAILPLYTQTDLTQSNWEINMKFTGDISWRKLGRIFMYSSTDNDTIKPITLQNLTTAKIPVRLLLAR